MKQIRFFLIILACCLASAAVFAQDSSNSELLPEKLAVPEVKAAETQQAPPWGVIVASCIAVGIILLFLEAAVIPGFGAAGILGILVLTAALILGFLKLSPARALIALGASVVALVLLVLWFLYVFPKTSMGSHFILQKSSLPEDGYVAGSDKSAYVGKIGVTATMLRPSGIAKIDGERVDVMTDGEFVEKDVEIKVVKIHENNVIVTPTNQEA